MPCGLAECVWQGKGCLTDTRHDDSIYSVLGYSSDNILPELEICLNRNLGKLLVASQGWKIMWVETTLEDATIRKISL